MDFFRSIMPQKRSWTKLRKRVKIYGFDQKLIKKYRSCTTHLLACTVLPLKSIPSLALMHLNSPKTLLRTQWLHFGSCFQTSHKSGINDWSLSSYTAAFLSQRLKPIHLTVHFCCSWPSCSFNLNPSHQVNSQKSS